MKKLAVGILAHVDAGKTTLSEGMLYLGGSIRRLGRVDHRDAFLDTEALERERGITIFSKQGVLSLGETELTLLDTPGHVDFSAEMERTLQVLDCAVLVVSGADGVQSHTRTLWQLLERFSIPTFLFLNKMDLAGADREALMGQLKRRLGESCVDFGPGGDDARRLEETALCDEQLLGRYLEGEGVTDGDVARLVARRALCPCYFGSALKLEGVEELLQGLVRYVDAPARPAEFGARVYKIARDPQGARLTYLKVTGGVLRVKDTLEGERDGVRWAEKADQIRVYSGAKYQTVEEACAGTVCAVTGLSRTAPGQGLGWEAGGHPPVLEPVLSYRLALPPDCDPHAVLPKLRLLEEEDPMLRLVWDEGRREIRVQLMGQVQLEVLKRLLLDRFGLAAEFDSGSIVYRETIADAVEGVGHFEPLRHYAEVRLLLEPGEAGSGLQFASVCSGETLDASWQRLVLTHLEEKAHLGVLTGSPITDMKITLLTGRAHLKHTEGGDFRQATYRAVRQGLMQAKSVLLEPWYHLRLEVPAENVGRAMSDLQRMGGQLSPPALEGDTALLTGAAPVAALGDYWLEVTAYTRGRGKLSCTVLGYRPCHNQEEVVAALGYDPERDVDNTPDSVFCAHGAGYVVKWDQVMEHAHVDSPLRPRREENAPGREGGGVSPGRAGALEQDRELQAIFERTYGKVERRAFQPQKKPARTSLDEGRYHVRDQRLGPDYLLVDGYNIIFAWEELKELARLDVAAARGALEDILINYQGLRKCEVILVFDAYKVKGSPGSVERKNGIYVVYTKEAETADAYIEKTTYDLSREHRVRVATSDGLEQLIILGHGALRVSARAFKAEVEQAQGEIARVIQQHNRRNRELGKVGRTAKIIREK